MSNEIESLGFAKAEWISISKPLSIDIYKSWIDQKLHGDMGYLETHLSKKENPQDLVEQCRSALVLAYPYFPSENLPHHGVGFKGLRTALYAQGQDYHHFIQSKLESVKELLRARFPNNYFVSFVDSSPVLERDWAYQASLGWVGKNTCLLDRKIGSLFFISEIVTDLVLDVRHEPIHDFCGTCNRCIEVCPTNALVEPRKLDATKCISYLTIESKTPPPVELREKMGDWFFGCDLCQTVCPWNQKQFKDQLSVAFIEDLSLDREKILLEELEFLLTASGKQILKRVQGTPLYRAGVWGLRRNALIVIGNRKLSSLRNHVETLQSNEKLADLVAWTLERL